MESGFSRDGGIKAATGCKLQATSCKQVGAAAPAAGLTGLPDAPDLPGLVLQEREEALGWIFLFFNNKRKVYPGGTFPFKGQTR